MLQRIRNSFWAGLISFAVGAGLLTLAFFLGQPEAGAARTLHNILALVALLLGAGGAFLAICTGAVLLVSMLAAPRVPRPQKS